MNFADSLSSEIISTHVKYSSKEITRPDYLPDKDEVTNIIKLLRRLLFPGYFEKNGINGTDMQLSVCGLVTETENMLRRQICRALNLESGECGNCAGMLDKAGDICRSFLKKIPDIIEILFSDVQATFNGDPAARSKHEIIFAYPGIFAISVFRMARELHMLDVPFLPRMMTEYAHSRTGIDIHPGAEIDGNFCIDHGTGIVIGETTKIGSFVKLYQGVTLGALSTYRGQDLRGKKRHPTLEDSVTVYSGASILGGDTVIGKGSVIGGNVFITKSIPSNTKVYLKNHELEYQK